MFITQKEDKRKKISCITKTISSYNKTQNHQIWKITTQLEVTYLYRKRMTTCL